VIEDRFAAAYKGKDKRHYSALKHKNLENVQTRKPHKNY
jgi:hypothetical protein